MKLGQGGSAHLLQQDRRSPADEYRAERAADEDREDRRHERVLAPRLIVRIAGTVFRDERVDGIQGEHRQRRLYCGLHQTPRVSA